MGIFSYIKSQLFFTYCVEGPQIIDNPHKFKQFELLMIYLLVFKGCDIRFLSLKSIRIILDFS